VTGGSPSPPNIFFTNGFSRKTTLVGVV